MRFSRVGGACFLRICYTELSCTGKIYCTINTQCIGWKRQMRTAWYTLVCWSFHSCGMFFFVVSPLAAKTCTGSLTVLNSYQPAREKYSYEVQVQVHTDSLYVVCQGETFASDWEKAQPRNFFV